MSQDSNLRVAQHFLQLMAEQAAAENIAALFSPNVSFEIPGDDGILPWIGRKQGRSAAAAFVTDLRTLTEPVKFEVHDILASDTRAVILVDLASRIKVNNQTIATSAAIILEIHGGAITRFLMIEDSFEVSRKARG